MKPRIVTFSKIFPANHPKKGEPTHFIEAILTQLKIDYTSHDYFVWLCENNRNIGIKFLHEFYESLSENISAKSHTIRKNKRPFVVGQEISAMIWAGKPYNKTEEGYWKIKFAPDFKITSVTDVDISIDKKLIRHIQVGMPVENKNNEWKLLSSGEVAQNDGLSYDDFRSWFMIYCKKGMCRYQVVCWNEKINYNKK